ncbi:MAG: phosphotransferase family protein [Bacillota bacterium]
MEIVSPEGAWLDSIGNLPLTLCQGDVHHDNLIFRDAPNGPDIYLIDWDSAGYGTMGDGARHLCTRMGIPHCPPLPLPLQGRTTQETLY